MRPVIAEPCAVADRHDRSEFGLVVWLMGATTYLHGKRPVDVIDEPATLLDVAAASFGVQR